MRLRWNQSFNLSRIRTPFRLPSSSARLDNGMNGFWGGKYKRCFIDVRVFNPHMQSNRANESRAMYAKHEREKRRLYERRILEIELASFTPLVFSVTGGMTNECDLFYQRLASMISSKCNQSYSQTLNWIRCSIPLYFFARLFSASEGLVPPFIFHLTNPLILLPLNPT